MIKKYIVVTGNDDMPGSFDTTVVEAESAQAMTDEAWQEALRESLKGDGYDEQDTADALERTFLVGIFPATTDYMVF